MILVLAWVGAHVEDVSHRSNEDRETRNNKKNRAAFSPFAEGCDILKRKQITETVRMGTRLLGVVVVGRYGTRPLLNYNQMGGNLNNSCGAIIWYTQVVLQCENRTCGSSFSISSFCDDDDDHDDECVTVGIDFSASGSTNVRWILFRGLVKEFYSMERDSQ